MKLLITPTDKIRQLDLKRVTASYVAPNGQELDGPGQVFLTGRNPAGKIGVRIWFDSPRCFADLSPAQAEAIEFDFKKDTGRLSGPLLQTAFR